MKLKFHSKKSSSTSDNNIVISEASGLRARLFHRPDRKQLLLIAVGVVVIAAIVVVVVLLTRPTPLESKQVAKLKQTLASKGVKFASLSPDQQAQYLADNGQYAAAQETYQNEYNSAKNDKTRLNILFQQAMLAAKARHYKEANNYAAKAKQLAPNSSTTYVALAQIAQTEGDKNSAKNYWQQAISKLDPKNPAYSLIKRDYQSSLEALK